MHIRRALLSDAQALSHLLAKVWRVAYQGIFPQNFLDNIQEDGWTVGFQQSLDNPDVQIFVAEEGKQLVGMIAFGKGRNSELDIENEIYALNVLPEFQQQKIGSTLMQLAFAKMADKPIYLKVAVKNELAQRFYLKHGFQNRGIQYPRQIADFRFQEWIYQRS
ncbi:GNAT family N-acetyltransferase [Frederiksenia canicola]